MIKIREVKINFNPLEVYSVFKNEKDTILLDSSNKDDNLSKFSFIGINLCPLNLKKKKPL